MTDSTRIGVDVGGTFTDVVLMIDEDTFVTAKVPSTADQSEGCIEGIEKACEKSGIASDEIDVFSHAMTVTTNALLEETGATTALITTEGFRDVLEIRRQDRPSLYDLDAELPTPLAPRRRRFEIDERATGDGIEQQVDAEEVRDIAATLDEREIESVAVCFLHSYAHPENEQRAAEVLRDELSVPVSVSHEVLAEFREYERTSTTVVDAYVTPAIDTYLGNLEERAGDLGLPEPSVMQSNGGIAAASTVRNRAVTTALSGPAAGVVGGAGMTESVSLSSDIEGHVTFDMGGTSSDVGLVRDGDIERTTHTSINGRSIATPMVDVQTVGAGGGSIAWVDAGGALRVGPRSAGADPGPACYGRGGTDPTVTDANVVLGYIGASTTLGGELELAPDAAEAVLDDLSQAADLDSPLAAAQGVYQVVNANMTRAIRSVTVEKGYDPRRFALVGFGGAGPIHAAELAARLDIGTVVVPLPCGVLSAYGLLAADEKHDAVRTHKRNLTDLDTNAVREAFDDLVDEVLDEVDDPNTATLERSVDLRYVGQSFELTVAIDDGNTSTIDKSEIRERFHASHETAYGYRMDRAVELVNLRTTATIERESISVAYEGSDDPQTGTRQAYFDDAFHETPVYARERLCVDGTISGPAILEQNESTTVIPPSWTGNVRKDGTVVLTEDGQ
jgi:N-methylhydantoinase A